jgi:hypothetical protein
MPTLYATEPSAPSQNPQKILPSLNGLNTVPSQGPDPAAELKTLLCHFLVHPEQETNRGALESHLEENGSTYLENPALSPKTAALVNDFVQHPSNQAPGKVPPSLQGLQQFNEGFTQIRQAVRPLSTQTQPALTAGFQKIEGTLNDLGSGKFGNHPAQTLTKATANSVKTAYNIVHQGVESATMQKHRNPPNDTEAKKISQAQERIKQARTEFAKKLQKGLELGIKTGQQAGEIAITFVPGGQVVGVSKTLTTATSGVVKAGQALQTAETSTRSVAAAVNGTKKAAAAVKPDAKTSPLQTAEKIAQAGQQIDSGIKRAGQTTEQQRKGAQDLQALPRI